MSIAQVKITAKLKQFVVKQLTDCDSLQRIADQSGIPSEELYKLKLESLRVEAERLQEEAECLRGEAQRLQEDINDWDNYDFSNDNI